MSGVNDEHYCPPLVAILAVAAVVVVFSCDENCYHQQLVVSDDGVLDCRRTV